MPDRFLLLYFDGPFQSWGCRSRHDFRDTYHCPTRSGVLGLLCAGMGIERHDTEALARLAPLRVKAYVLSPERERLLDYQTVGGGYDDLHQDFQVRTADGDIGSTVVTRREYLVAARFAVVVGGDRELIAKCADGVKNPRWGIWLGRKSCLPASIIFRGVFESHEEAREAVGRLAESRSAGQEERLRIIREVGDLRDSTSVLMDDPLDFSRRLFGPRMVADGLEGGDADF